VVVAGGWLAVCVPQRKRKSLKKIKFIVFPTHYDYSCPLLIEYTDVKIKLYGLFAPFSGNVNNQIVLLLRAL
jgi:hypothetical protein